MQGFRFPQAVHRDIAAVIVSALPFPEVAFWQLVPAGQEEHGLWHRQTEGLCSSFPYIPQQVDGKGFAGPSRPCLLHLLSDLRSHHGLWAIFFFLVPDLTLLPSFPGEGSNARRRYLLQHASLDC